MLRLAEHMASCSVWAGVGGGGGAVGGVAVGSVCVAGGWGGRVVSWGG